MRFVRPFDARQGAIDQAVAHMGDGLIVFEQSDGVVGHFRVSFRNGPGTTGPDQAAGSSAWGAACLTPSSTWLSNCAKLSMNWRTSFCAVAS